MITKASSILYVATRNRAYFKSVRILVPKEWDNVQAAFNTWETYTVRIFNLNKKIQ
jgi:calcium-activated chloride channel regulator 3/4